MADGPTVTWLGHATVDVRAGGTRLLTDPLLRYRVAHLRRHGRVPDLGADPVDAVLVSHLHHDHLDLPSLQRLPPTRLVVPKGSGSLVKGTRHDVVEVAPGDTFTVGEVAVEVVPADHSGSRALTRVKGPPLGYVLTAGGRRVYFPGDTDLFEEMAALGPVDLALLPIWGWGPSLGPGHLDPHRAAEAAAVLQAGAVLPIHWGTYSPIRGVPGRPAWLDRPAAAFERELARAAPATTLHRHLPGPAAVVRVGG